MIVTLLQVMLVGNPSKCSSSCLSGNTSTYYRKYTGCSPCRKSLHIAFRLCCVAVKLTSEQLHARTCSQHPVNMLCLHLILQHCNITLTDTPKSVYKSFSLHKCKQSVIPVSMHMLLMSLSTVKLIREANRRC